MNIEIFGYKEITPFKSLGLTSPFWTIHLDTLIYTWVAMLFLFILALIGQGLMKKKISTSSLAFEKSIIFFMNLYNESFATFNINQFSFIISIFFFTLFCCLVGLIPFLDESTKDLNTTFALGATSFFYVQSQKVKAHGFLGYCKEFTQPFLVLLPLNIIGEFAKIASMSFRLFGNILGGSIILSMIIQGIAAYQEYFLGYVAIVLLAILITQKIMSQEKYPLFYKALNIASVSIFCIAWLQMFFGIFEGIIQAFVLTMLTITYLATGLDSD